MIGSGLDGAAYDIPESGDEALPSWITGHRAGLGLVPTAVRVVAAGEDTAAPATPRTAGPGWIEDAVATALARGPFSSGGRYPTQDSSTSRGDRTS